MDVPSGKEMVEGKLWDYDTRDSGIGEPPSFSQVFADFVGDDHQPQADVNVTSFLEHFENENLEEAVMTEGIAADSFTANENGSFFEENPTLAKEMGMSNEIPTFVDGDVVMAEIGPPYHALVHHLASLSDVAFMEFMTSSDTVYDRIVSSMKMGKTAPTQVTLERLAVVSHETQNGVERGVVNDRRPDVSVDNGSIRRVAWTPALHKCFVDAVEQLGGCECRYSFFYYAIVIILLIIFSLFMNVRVS